jgi:4-amino-4-deoxy-L-arabinose transferase-like glycosyltransferase
LLLLLGLQLVRGLFYSAVVPPWQGPDEPWHYEYVSSVAAQGSGPALSAEMESSLRTFNLWRFHWTDTPQPGLVSSYSLWHTSLLTPQEGYSPLHPMLLVPFYMLTSPLDITSRLLLLRLASVLLGMGTVFLLFLAAAVLFPEEDSLIIGIPAFVVFMPMHTFMTSVLNSDNLTEFWASLALFFMLTWFHRGLSLWRMLGAALAVTLGVLTKRTAVFLIPLFIFAVAIYARRWVPKEKERWAVGLAVLVSLVSLAGLGLFIVYLGPYLQGGILASFVPHALDSQELFTAVQGEGFFKDFIAGVQNTFVSFWAAFGWGNVSMARGWYAVLAAASLAVAAGFILYLFRFYRTASSAEKWRAEAIIFLLIALLLALLIGLGAMVFLGGKYRTGLHIRYFLPVIIPIATLFLLGWRELFPPQYRRFAVPVLLTGLTLFDATAMAYYIIPFFYS